MGVANLTTDEAAAELRVTVRTVQKWCRDGVLAAEKVGPKLWRIPAGALADIRRPAPPPRRLRPGGDPVRQRAAAEYLDRVGL